MESDMICMPIVEGNDIYSHLLESRIIILNSEINAASANIVVAQLLYLSAKDPKADIKLYINSPGGSMTDGYAIVDTMNFIPNDVSTICVGMAASMAAFILATGAENKRFILPNGEVMVHQPSSGIGGQITDVVSYAAYMDKCKKKYTKQFAELTHNDYDDFYQLLERDTFLDADEACKLGIVDSILLKKEGA